MYCYSVYVRSAVPATIQLVVTATGQTALTPVTTASSWTRVIATGQAFGSGRTASASECNCRPGAQVDAFGAQVEAQPAAGLYKKTIDLGGVYPSTRFSSDLLSFTATAPESELLPDRFDQQLELNSTANREPIAE